MVKYDCNWPLADLSNRWVVQLPKWRAILSEWKLNLDLHKSIWHIPSWYPHFSGCRWICWDICKNKIIYIYISRYIRINIYIWVFQDLNLYICNMYIFTFIFIHIYIYSHIYIVTYIQSHIYIYIYLSPTCMRKKPLLSSHLCPCLLVSCLCARTARTQTEVHQTTGDLT